MSNENRVVGYARCSTHEQGDLGLSLEGQRGRIEAWCTAADFHLVEIIQDKGVSGSRALSQRSGGSRVSELLGQRHPEVGAVVVVRLDRLGRDAAETLQLLKQFTRGKVGLISITDRLDLTTPQGRAMAGVAAVFSELERGLIGQRTADALDRLRTQGRAYGPTPFGYNCVDGLLVKNEAEQTALALIADLRDVGHSYAVIAARLNGAGIPSKRGGPWASMSVRSVLRTRERLGSTTPQSFPAVAQQPS